MGQHPLCFEFTEHFLIRLLDHLYSCKYGTFLCNSVKEREEHKLKERTLSLWTHLQNCTDAEQNFVNPYYKDFVKQITPKYSLKVLRFWKAWHLRHCPEHIMRAKPTYSETGEAQIRQLYQQLQQQNEELRAQISRLSTEQSAAAETAAKLELNKKSAHRPPADLLQDSQFD